MSNSNGPTKVASQLDRPRVLVVDNEHYIRLLAGAALKQAGYDVVTAENGKEALEVFQQTRPDLILLDMNMPVMDGFTACARLREMPIGKHVPVLVMTGYDDPESIKSAYEAGATDFAVKPVNWVILRHRIEYMLRASQAAAELRESQSKLTNAQRIARLGYWEWNPASGRLTLSQDLNRILGRHGEKRIKELDDFLKLVHRDDRERLGGQLQEILEDAQPRETEYRLVRPDGSERFVSQQAEPTLDDDGRILRVISTVQDVTERKHAEERIRYLAYYDALTDLPNRRSFAKRLDVALAAVRRHDGKMGVLFLDLDRFKRINDSLGHAAGDELLKQVSAKLQGCVRSTDCVSRPVDDSPDRQLVARLGGDEFVVLLSDISGSEDAARVAGRLVASLDGSFNIGGQEVFLTASIGIAVYPEDGRNAETLIKNADTAMYHAKEQGGNNFQYYAHSMNATALERLMLESNLGKALERDELVLYYQPQYDLATRRIVGVEALIRWIHPEMGTVSPMKFIPVAEKTGLIDKIDDWVVRTACAQARAWLQAGLPALRVAVNLSSRQFGQNNFPQRLAQILEETRMDPDFLDLEMTESTLMQDGDETVKILAELKAMGVRLSIDDFGTGYSSLSYLMRFPVDALKIDRSFLKGVPEKSDHVTITSAILAMARSLDLAVVAEGVETEEQLAFLAAKGCDEMQGFLLARPMPADEFVELFAAADEAPDAPDPVTADPSDGDRVTVLPAAAQRVAADRARSDSCPETDLGSFQLSAGASMGAPAAS